MTDLKLEGFGPFDLPLVQNVRVSGDPDVVIITLGIVDEGHEKKVNVRLSQTAARTLRDRLPGALSSQMKRAVR